MPICARFKASAGNDIRFLHEQAEQKRDVRDPPALRLFVVRVVRVERAEGRCVGKSHVRVVRVVRVEHAQAAGRNSLLKADARIRPPRASVAYRQQGPSGAFGFCFVTWLCGCAPPPPKKKKGKKGEKKKKKKKGSFFCGRRQMATGHRTTAAPRPFAQRRARPPRGFGALP